MSVLSGPGRRRSGFPGFERTIAQLAGIRYSHNARGQIIIESKEDARKRGVKSPDRAEAVMLAFAEVRVLVLGLVEYLKEPQEEMDRQAGTALEGAAEIVKQCPKCGSVSIARLNAGWRCGQCGLQGGPKPEVYRSPSRADLFKNPWGD